jgi:predicted hydrocarbon binding protein
MGRAKGSVFLGMHAFLAERGDGPAIRRAVASALSPKSADAFLGAIAVGWYPLDSYIDAVGALGGALGLAPDEAARAYGRYAAEHDLTTIHRFFLRLANPAYVLEKAGEYWGRYFDTGAWTVTRERETRALADLTAFDAVDRVYCESLTAYVQRMFELAGAREVRVTHVRCRARRADRCSFAIEWR